MCLHVCYRHSTYRHCSELLDLIVFLLILRQRYQQSHRYPVIVKEEVSTDTQILGNNHEDIPNVARYAKIFLSFLFFILLSAARKISFACRGNILD